jgi:5'-methylthioadenosine phosphorylase
MTDSVVGVIGGSGLYELEGLEEVQMISLMTPFGAPSDLFQIGRLNGIKLVFLPRHGKGHRIQPSSVNFRANIYGMKKLGAEWIIGVSAVGSMKASIQPGDMVIPNQFIDMTKGRINTFFSDGIVAHVNFADPVCPVLSQILFQAVKDTGVTVHNGGTYLCIEGPQFSTRAESNLYRSWGVDIIGMTNLPEAKLAREAEICYSTIAIATDYDCWKEEAGDISIGEILRILSERTKTARSAIRHAIRLLPQKRHCVCATALKYAVTTGKSRIPESTRKDLEPIIGRYLS